jgi:hypothetical protein
MRTALLSMSIPGSVDLDGESASRTKPIAMLDSPPMWVGTVAAVALMVVFVLASLRRRRQTADRLRKCQPLVTFFTELSKPEASERKLAQLFDPRVLLTIERATLKAINRCLYRELGDFVSLDAQTARFVTKLDEEGQTRYKAIADCDFTLMKQVRCEMSWAIRTATNKAHALSFRVKPKMKELDVLNHVDPHDFEGFGENFITAMISKSPEIALERMAPSLAQNVGSSAGVTAEMTKVVKVMGGLKERQLDLNLTNAKETTVGQENNKRRALELEYLMLGNVRDVRVTLCIVFSGLRAVVLRYSFLGLAVRDRHIFVDESGRPLAEAAVSSS